MATVITYGIIAAFCLLFCNAADPQLELINPLKESFYKRGISKLELPGVVKEVVVNVSLHQDADLPDANLSVLAGTLKPACNMNLDHYQKCELISSSPQHPRILQFRCSQALSKFVVAVYHRQEDEPVREIIVHSSEHASSHDEDEVEEIKQEVAARYSGLPNTTVQGQKNSCALKLIGRQATALAVTQNNNVLIGMSAVGNGTIIVMGNEKYLRHQTLIEVLMKWAYSKNPIGGVNAELEDLRSQIGSNGVLKEGITSPLIWNMDHPLSAENIARLIQEVRKGVTLLTVITPWKYEQKHSKLQEATWVPLLAEAGIWPTTKMAREIQSKTDTMILGDERAQNAYSVVVQAALSEYSMGAFGDLPNVLWGMQDMPSLYYSVGNSKTQFRRSIINSLERWKPMVESCLPCMFSPLKDEKHKSLLYRYNLLMNLDIMAYSEFEAPAVFIYPGETLAEPTSITQTQKIPLAGEVIPTGYYLPAGKTTNVTLVEGNATTCKLIVNFNLLEPPYEVPMLKWPLPKVESIDFSSNTVLFSPIGGLLWIQCSEVREFRYQLSNVVEAPRYDLRDEMSQAEWDRRRSQAEAPWATVASDTVVIVVPSKSIRGISNIKEIMKTYDLAFRSALHLAGYDPSTRKREVMATDVQIKIGLLHDGYPIGMNLKFALPEDSAYVFNSANLKLNGAWGLFHEQGHNLQDDAYVFSGSEQVSCNIFALRATEVVTGGYYFTDSPSWVDMKNVKKFLRYPKFSKWKKKPRVALIVFAQLAHHFGWELYRQVFRRYRDMSTVERSTLTTDQQKIDKFIILTSEVANYNLVPLFEFWGFPIRAKIKTGITSRLVPFLPEDLMMAHSRWKHLRILRKFSNVVRTVHRLNQTIGAVKNCDTIMGSTTFPSIL